MKNIQINIYVSSILMTLAIISPFFIMQVVLVYGSFSVKALIAPLAVGTFIGILIARIRILKKRLDFREKIFQAIANEAKEFSYFKDLNGHYLYVSPSVKALTGYSEETFMEHPDFFPSLIIDSDKHIWNEHCHEVHTQSLHKTIEFRIKVKDNKIIWISHNCAPIFDAEKLSGYRSANSNITSQKEHEDEIIHLAHHDSLTQLPNRLAIFTLLNEKIKKANPFTLLFLDLNRFKHINDSFGHATGDKILLEVTRNLKHCAPTTFIGRLGGDEFVIILDNVSHKSDIQLVIDKLLPLIDKDYYIDDLVLYISGSIGIAKYPQDTTKREDLLACADRAMYHAKKLKGRSFIYFSDLLPEDLEDEFILEKDLRQAVKNRELAIHLQAKVDAPTQTITSYEALIRWERDGSFISPVHFIAIAEKTGLIRDITRFVIHEVFSVAQKWYKEGHCHRFSINISVVDLMSNYLIDDLRSALIHYQVEASWFELEMTESLFLEQTTTIKDLLNELIAMGFTLALDDFGTGYSSLSYLTNFPIQTLKIDKSFIDNLEENYDKNYPLLKAILNLAKDLELLVVAEGVETRKALDILVGLGCNTIQGYYFFKPQTVIEMHQHLQGLKP